MFDKIGNAFWLLAGIALIVSVGSGPTQRHEVIRIALILMVVCGIFFMKHVSRHGVTTRAKTTFLAIESTLLVVIVISGYTSGNFSLSAFGPLLCVILLIALGRAALKRRLKITNLQL